MSGRAATTGVIPGRFALSVGKPPLPAPEGWAWTMLTDVARLESGHTPSRRHPEYWDGDIPWIGIKDAGTHHGRTILDTTEHITPSGVENSAARLLPADTVCLSRTASVGYVTVMGRPMTTSQDFVNWVCSPSLLPAYLKYVLLSELDALSLFSTGSTHQTIYFPEVKAFHVLLPPVEVQRAIVDVLGALDDKIDLNRRTHETFDGLVRHHYESIRGGATGTHILDVQGVPFKLADVCSRIAMGPFGSDIKAENYVDSGVPVVRGANMGNPFVIGPFVYVTDAKASDLINAQALAADIVVTHRGTLGQVSIIPNEKVATRYLVSQSQMVLSVDRTRTSPYWVFEFLRSPEGQARILANASQTGVPAISRPVSNLKMIPLPLPTKASSAIFHDLAETLWDNAWNLHLESRTLADLRDALMPRLLSGTLTVRDAEKVVLEAGA